MTSITFEATSDSVSGELGLLPLGPKRSPYCNGLFGASSAFHISHDIVEHQKGLKSIGTYGDELIALGGIINSRGQHDFYVPDDPRSGSCPVEVLSSDLVHLGEDMISAQLSVRSPLRDTKGEYALDWMIEESVERAEKEMLRSLEAERETSCRLEFTGKETPFIRKEFERKKAATDLYIAQARNLMYQGLALSTRRYGSGHLAFDIFWEISDAFEPIFRDELFEGEQFTLTYNHSGKVLVRRSKGEYSW